MQPPPTQVRVRRRIPLVAVVLILVALICLGLIVLIPAVMIPTMRRMAAAGGCGASFSMMRQAVLMYAQDHEGVLPIAANWEDAVASFYQGQYELTVAELQGTQIDRYIQFVKPGEVFSCVDDNGRRTGISFNSELSGARIAEIPDKRNAVLLFEVPTAGRNQHSVYEMVRAPKPRMLNTHRDWLVIPLEGDHLGFTEARDAARGAQQLMEIGQTVRPAPK